MNQHDFKPGDRAIVTPSPRDAEIYCGYKSHFLTYYSFVTIVNTATNSFPFIKCLTKDCKIQFLEIDDIQPLPIPYHLLDAE